MGGGDDSRKTDNGDQDAKSMKIYYKNKPQNKLNMIIAAQFQHIGIRFYQYILKLERNPVI